MSNTVQVAKQFNTKKEKSARASSLDAIEGLKEGLDDLRAGRTLPIEEMLDDIQKEDETN